MAYASQRKTRSQKLLFRRTIPGSNHPPNWSQLERMRVVYRRLSPCLSPSQGSGYFQTSFLPKGVVRQVATVVLSVHTSSQTNLDVAVCGSTDVDVNEAPGAPDEYGDMFP